jgi:hypothetical protein
MSFAQFLTPSYLPFGLPLSTNPASSSSPFHSMKRSRNQDICSSPFGGGPTPFSPSPISSSLSPFSSPASSMPPSPQQKRMRMDTNFASPSPFISSPSPSPSVSLPFLPAADSVGMNIVQRREEDFTSPSFSLTTTPGVQSLSQLPSSDSLPSCQELILHPTMQKRAGHKTKRGAPRFLFAGETEGEEEQETFSSLKRNRMEEDGDSSRRKTTLGEAEEDDAGLPRFPYSR